MNRVLSLTMITIILLIGSTSGIISLSNTITNHETETIEPLSRFDSQDHYINAEVPEVTGIIDPVLVEQAGYIESNNVSARTDTGENTRFNLTIDEANNWIGSVAEIDIWNLNRLYVVNGSFDDGIPGKNPNPGSTTYYPYGWSSSSSGSENQYASYVKQAENYVTTENQGEPGGLFSDYFDHYTGSYVVWYQTIDNTPASTQFVLSFDYLYLTGPIYNAGGDNPGGYASIIISIDGTIEWSLNLLDLDERNLWYESGDIILDLPSVGSSFSFAIGVYVYDGMRLYPDRDYDNDGSEDGAANTGTILVHFDDISLASTTSPDMDELDMTFVAGVQSTPIIGSSGSGSATITNPSLWSTDPLTTEITSNTTVTFDFQVRLLSHRFINSTWSTDTSKEGVQYSVESGLSPQMTLFAYVGIVDPYQDFYVNILHPVDWENITVYDPFRNDVSTDIIKRAGMCTIPTELVTRLGWWEIILEAPNYANDMSTQSYDGSWTPDSLFRSSDTIRGQIDIGTSVSTPVIDNPVEFNWLLPNATSWSTDTIPVSPSSLVNSNQRTIGGMNTTAGEWTLSSFWTNGSEVAYGSVQFDVYHSASLELVYPDQDVIETSFGLTVSNLLYYKDADNNQFVVDELTEITSNWSVSAVTFTPNFVKNWYEADFDTSLLSGGSYLVVVNASRPFFDDISIQQFP